MQDEIKGREFLTRIEEVQKSLTIIDHALSNPENNTIKLETEFEEVLSTLKDIGNNFKCPKEERSKIDSIILFLLELNNNSNEYYDFIDNSQTDYSKEEKEINLIANKKIEYIDFSLDLLRTLQDISSEFVVYLCDDIIKKLKEISDSIYDPNLSVYWGFCKYKYTLSACCLALFYILENLKYSSPISEESLENKLESLPAIAAMPNGDSFNFLIKTLNRATKQNLMPSKKNRHEDVIMFVDDKGNFKAEKENKGNKITIEITQPKEFISKSNKTFSKLIRFTMQKLAEQHFGSTIMFSLDDMVKYKMYKSKDTARVATKRFFNQLSNIKVSGKILKGPKVVEESTGILFYNLRIANNVVYLSLNENYNLEFLAPYFTAFPTFAYSLSANAFDLICYIFFLARQNSKKIRDYGHFNISLETIRDYLGLPTPEEAATASNTYNYIKKPINDAIEEIELVLKDVPEATNYGFTITPNTNEAKSVNDWLLGYIEVGLRYEFADLFIKLANDKEKKVKRELNKKKKAKEKAIENQKQKEGK